MLLILWEHQMKTVLAINASARFERSITRTLMSQFIDELKSQLGDEVTFIERDVAAQPPSFIGQDWIEAVFMEPQERSNAQQKLLQESDTYLCEIKSADLIVIACPMYNYGMPAYLKAWFDQVVRINETFSFDLQRGDFPLEPILSGKTLLCLTSKGEFGFNSGESRAHMNYLDGHLDVLSHYLGVQTRHAIGVEYQEFSDQRHEQSKAEAKQACFDFAQVYAESFSDIRKV